MSNVIKFGPRLGGTVVDAGSRAVKFRFRTVCRLDEVKQLRLREYFSQLEEEQFLNRNPAVQKSQRDAELYAETKDGRSVLIGVLDQAGLLLDHAVEIARVAGQVPVVTERVHLQADRA
ncbi:MAG TPA: hypothetical protein VIG99_04565 [Myxococcaceae bacterium]